MDSRTLASDRVLIAQRWIFWLVHTSKVFNHQLPFVWQINKLTLGIHNDTILRLSLLRHRHLHVPMDDDRPREGIDGCTPV